MNNNINNNAYASDREERFANKFNESVEQFEYSRGYDHSDKPIWIKCKLCGTETKRSGGFLRKVIRNEKGINCKCCGKSNITNVHKITVTKNCRNCEKEFRTNLGEMYCSEQCMMKNKNRRREFRGRREYKILKLANLYDSSITLDKLIIKEKNVCYLCGGQCNTNDFTIDDRGSFIVGREYPSIDHVKPISKGGTHTSDNVKLAHHYCNSIKRDTEIVEDSGQMILML